MRPRPRTGPTTVRPRPRPDSDIHVGLKDLTCVSCVHPYVTTASSAVIQRNHPAMCWQGGCIDVDSASAILCVKRSWAA